ncbi:MAG: hypothetical protein WC107_06330 [Patescibacteria group bacterium]|jgi:predicted RNA-binding Zn-ribbon protein involved in translation (DUF1610 family)
MSEYLTRCEGPECPFCGCNQAEILVPPKPQLGQASWFGAGRAKCGHCRAVFSFRELPKPQTIPPPAIDAEPFDVALPVIEKDLMKNMEIQLHVVTAPKCPDCGGDTRISSTRKTRRYHKCLDCGKTITTAR